MILKPKLGVHASVEGGLAKAIERASNMGAQCIQIFGASPQRWKTKMPSIEEADEFKKAAKKIKLEAVYLHASYLVNLASPTEPIRHQSIVNLGEHFRIAQILEAKGLIFHLGSAMDSERGEAILNVVESVKSVLKTVEGDSKLILENSSGGGQKIGSNLGELGEIFKKIDSERVGVCLDTAHLFEAGVIDEYIPDKIKKVLDDFDKEVGLENLLALHINDSKTAFDSHHDRHENIGEGYIGRDGFRNLAKEKRLWGKDWILEVPGFDGQGPDKKNLDILKACFK